MEGRKSEEGKVQGQSRIRLWRNLPREGTRKPGKNETNLYRIVKKEKKTVGVTRGQQWSKAKAYASNAVKLQSKNKTQSYNLHSKKKGAGGMARLLEGGEGRESMKIIVAVWQHGPKQIGAGQTKLENRNGLLASPDRLIRFAGGGVGLDF